MSHNSRHTHHQDNYTNGGGYLWPSGSQNYSAMPYNYGNVHGHVEYEARYQSTRVDTTQSAASTSTSTFLGYADPRQSNESSSVSVQTQAQSPSYASIGSSSNASGVDFNGTSVNKLVNNGLNYYHFASPYNRYNACYDTFDESDYDYDIDDDSRESVFDENDAAADDDEDLPESINETDNYYDDSFDEFNDIGYTYMKFGDFGMYEYDSQDDDSSEFKSVENDEFKIPISQSNSDADNDSDDDNVSSKSNSDEIDDLSQSQADIDDDDDHHLGDDLSECNYYDTDDSIIESEEFLF